MNSSEIEVRTVGKVTLVSSTSSSPAHEDTSRRLAYPTDEEETSGGANPSGELKGYLRTKYGSRLAVTNDIRDIPPSLSGTLEFLGTLTSVTSLDLSGCKLLEGSLEPISSLHSLSWLSCQGCDALGGTLAPLVPIGGSLRHLDLSNGSDEYVSMGWTGDIAYLSALTRLEELDVGGCNGTYDVETREYADGLHGDWFEVLPDLPSLKSLSYANTKISGKKYCNSLRQLVVTAAAIARAEEATLDDRKQQQRLLAEKVKAFFKSWVAWRYSVESDSHEAACITEEAEKSFFEKLLLVLLVEGAEMDREWLLLHVESHEGKMKVASKILHAVAQNEAENSEVLGAGEANESLLPAFEELTLQTPPPPPREAPAPPPPVEEMVVTTRGEGAGRAPGDDAKRHAMETALTPATATVMESSRDSFDIDFSMLLDVGPGRAIVDDNFGHGRDNSPSEARGDADRVQLVDEKTRAVRAVFRVRERLEAAERDLARAAADREQLERRHKEELKQQQKRHDLELEAAKLRYTEDRFHLEKTYSAQLAVERSRTQLALEIGENLQKLLKSSVLFEDAASSVGAAHAANAASAAANAAIDAANAAVRAADVLAIAATPSPPKYVGESELRFVGGFVALNDRELEQLDADARMQYDERRRTHERLTRSRAGGRSGGGYLAYGGGRSGGRQWSSSVGVRGSSSSKRK